MCSEPSCLLFTSLGSFGARPLEADIGFSDSVICSAGADVFSWLPPVQCSDATLALSVVAGSALVAGGVACLIGLARVSGDDAG